MNWSVHLKPGDIDAKDQNYDHIYAESPLGLFIITWKSWKERPDYTIELKDFDTNSERYIDSAYEIADAKAIAFQYLSDKYQELRDFFRDI